MSLELEHSCKPILISASHHSPSLEHGVLPALGVIRLPYHFTLKCPEDALGLEQLGLCVWRLLAGAAHLNNCKATGELSLPLTMYDLGRSSPLHAAGLDTAKAKATG